MLLRLLVIGPRLAYIGFNKVLVEMHFAKPCKCQSLDEISAAVRRLLIQLASVDADSKQEKDARHHHHLGGAFHGSDGLLRVPELGK